jgi:hypothetical protein
MTDRLSEFGYTFQIKIITCLFNDRNFLQQSLDILDPMFFENESNQYIVRIIKEYFQEYKSPPTMEVMKVKLADLDDGLLRSSIIENMKESLRYLGSDDLDFIMERTIEFCKNQEIKKAILQSVELLKNGQYDAIKSKIDAAMTAGGDRQIGHEWADDIDARYEESVREVKTTGWDEIDNLMDGGLGKGELGVVVAPAGIGKSYLLVNLGVAAVKAGLNVLHYTLELNEAYVGLRYDSVITGIANQELKYSIDDIKDTVAKIPGDLVIKYYPTKGASINTVRSHIEKYKILGKKPDLILIDYADLLKGNGSMQGRDLRHELGNIYEEMRGLAGELELPIWTASQSNRSSASEEIIEADKIAESYSKIMIADFVMSLSRKIEDKVNGTGRIHVIKNRFGPDGITFPSTINTNNGSFEIMNQNSVQGAVVQQSMDNSEETIRRILKQKMDNFSTK